MCVRLRVVRACVCVCVWLVMDCILCVLSVLLGLLREMVRG